MELISVKDLADALRISERAVQLKAKSNQWPFIEEPHPSGKGRPVRKYKVSGLPDNIRRMICHAPDQGDVDADDISLINNEATARDDGTGTDSQIIRAQETAAAATVRRPFALEERAAAAVSLSIDASALARADLLRLYKDFIDSAEFGQKAEARDRFMTAYNSGIAYPVLFENLGSLSWKTIEAWKTAVKRAGGDTAVLSDRRGRSTRGNGPFSQDQEDILVRCMLHPNRPQIAEIIRMAKAIMHTKGIKNGLSDATYRRWILNWKNNHYPIWVFHRQGEKAWNDECAYYIERDYNMINVGDILVADGHVLNFEIINPWTGKPKRMALILWYDMKSTFPCGWEIMPTEDTAAISSALRRAIITLGKAPKVVYLDNGKAFRARLFSGCPSFEESGLTGLYDRLGCKTIFAWPYHGQSKTVERFFGTMAEVERWVPTYSGTSIDKKPPRMNRGERLHRKIYEMSPYSDGITLEDAHMVIAAWFDEYVTREKKSGHMKGLRPIDVFTEGRGPGIDKVDLTYLMMSMEIRHIRRNGIHFLGQNYYAPELYGRRRPVMIRYDLQDKSALHVCEPDGTYICLATPVEKIHPAAHALGTEADQECLKTHIAVKQRQKKDASRYARELLVNEIMPEHNRRMELLGVTGQAAIQAPAEPKQIEMSEAEKARILAEASAMEAIAAPEADNVIEIPEVVSDLDEQMARLANMSEPDRYEALLELEVRGADLTAEHRAFMRYFELTPAYEKNADYFEDRRALMTTMWQAK